MKIISGTIETYLYWPNDIIEQNRIGFTSDIPTSGYKLNNKFTLIKNIIPLVNNNNLILFDKNMSIITIPPKRLQYCHIK